MHGYGYSASTPSDILGVNNIDRIQDAHKGDWS